MPGKVLIVDPVATNRIILKVKLSAGHFDVIQAGSGPEAVRLVATCDPNLVLLSNALPRRESEAVIDILRARTDQAAVPIAVLLDDETEAADRRRVLARADAVITRPFNDALLLARLRGLLHRQNRFRDLSQQAATGTNGFKEEGAALAMPGRVALLAPGGAAGSVMMRGLSRQSPHAITLGDATNPFATLSEDTGPDAVVMYLPNKAGRQALQLLAELRAAPATRHAHVLAVLDSADERAAIRLLDAGLDDVILGETDYDEIAMRLDSLVGQAQALSRLRMRLRDGVRASVIDPLTGLYNRRYALPYLQGLAQEVRDMSGGDDFAVMLADLDHFKQINDRFGHGVGDQVLERVSDTLRAGLRQDDMIARIGGEEFLMILPDISAGEAHAIADRLCRTVAQTPIHATGIDRPVTVTVSIGVVMGQDGIAASPATAFGAHTPGQPDAAHALLALADRELYAAKAQGRNTVTFRSRSAA